MADNSSQVITCSAAVCWGTEELALKVEEIQVDPPKSTEVRIKMLCASVCHTDILFLKGLPFPLYPRVAGHEGVGVVESVGDGVKDLKQGDVVIPAYIGECEECEYCKSGRTNLCLKYPFAMSGLMPDNTSRMSVRGQKLYQFLSCSTWSEYTVVDSNYVVKIDPTISLPHGSFISCGFTSGFGATWKEAMVEKGSSVAVFGLGAVGLGAIEGARISGADKIIGIDKNGKKKQKGQVFGMTEFINPIDSDKSASESIKELTHGVGVDYCFECTGVAAVLDEAMLSIKMGKGKVITIGVGYGTRVEIDYRPLLFGGSLKGSIFGGLKIKSDLPTILEKCKNKEFHLEELLTHEVPLQDINKVFDLLQQPDCVKVESIGDEGKDLKEGDLVIPAYIGECKECQICKSGKSNLWLKCPFRFNGLMPDGTSRMSVRGQKLYHLFSCSTWSEYTVIDSNYVVKINDPNINLAHASFLSCGFSSGFGSAWKEAMVEKGSTIAVIGLGAVGLGLCI